MVVIVQQHRNMVRTFSYWKLSVFDWWRYSSVGCDVHMLSPITDAECLVGDVNRQMVPKYTYFLPTKRHCVWLVMLIFRVCQNIRMFSPVRDTVWFVTMFRWCQNVHTFSFVRETVLWLVTLIFIWYQNVHTFSCVRETVLWLVTLIFVWYQNVHTFFPVRDTLCVTGGIDFQVVSNCTLSSARDCQWLTDGSQCQAVCLYT